MTVKYVLAIPLLAIVLCGCSSVRQEAQSVVYDIKAGTVTTNSISARITTTGNAKTAVESLRGSVGKTISLGAKGVNEETDMAATIKAIGDVAEQVFAAGAAAGAATVAKSIAP